MSPPNYDVPPRMSFGYTNLASPNKMHGPKSSCTSHGHLIGAAKGAQPARGEPFFEAEPGKTFHDAESQRSRARATRSARLSFRGFREEWEYRSDRIASRVEALETGAGQVGGILSTARG